MNATVAGDLFQIVSFRLAGEEYAFPITAVKEVILPTTITRVPQMPACIEGVLNLRGTVIPVVDLRLRFGMPRAEHNEQTRILIAKPGGRVVGFIVDAVSQVLRIRRDQVNPPPETISGIAQKYLNGLARISDERMLILLDVASILSPAELTALAQPAA